MGHQPSSDVARGAGDENFHSSEQPASLLHDRCGDAEACDGAPSLLPIELPPPIALSLLLSSPKRPDSTG